MAGIFGRRADCLAAPVPVFLLVPPEAANAAAYARDEFNTQLQRTGILEIALAGGVGAYGAGAG